MSRDTGVTHAFRSFRHGSPRYQLSAGVGVVEPQNAVCSGSSMSPPDLPISASSMRATFSISSATAMPLSWAFGMPANARVRGAGEHVGDLGVA